MKFNTSGCLQSNNFENVYIASNFFQETILVFRVYKDVILQLLIFGCYVEIELYEVYKILSNAALLYERDINCCSDVILLFIMQITSAVSLHESAVNCDFLCGNFHYVWEENINLVFGQWDVGSWTGSSSLWVLTSGGHLGLRY